VSSATQLHSWQEQMLTYCVQHTWGTGSAKGLMVLLLLMVL
jgi:hypothetical protein